MLLRWDLCLKVRHIELACTVVGLFEELFRLEHKLNGTDNSLCPMMDFTVLLKFVNRFQLK